LSNRRFSLAKQFKPIMALVLAFLTLLGIAPMNVMAQAETASRDFIYFDDERMYLDDERILNVVNVSVESGNLSRAVAFSNQPVVTRVFGISGSFSREPDVFMNTRRVSAQRYAVEIDGVLYEAFCADPQLPGPESTGAVYELVGPAAARYNTVLRYGFPTNPYFSQAPHAEDTEDRLWNAYVTRVAVAMANNPNHNFTGNQYAISQARDLVNGTSHWVRNFDETHPAIMVNGERWAEDFDNFADGSIDIVQSDTFTVTYNRRNQNLQNRFRFEWASGTPVGAELVVNGNVLATAPTNSGEVFWGNVSFHIQMPNNADTQNQEAKVYLVGIHNQYANRVWLMQSPNNRDGWQDIVFYIPYMRASAAFSFEPVEEEGTLRIVKRNPSGRGLAGAVFQITGPDGFSVTRTTPNNGVIFLAGLEPGEYTVTEITPPPGHYLAENTSQTVTIQPNSTATVEVVFINEPMNGNGPTPEPRTADFPSVRIQKVDALTRENIPGALMRIEGRSSFQMVTADGQIWEIDNTGIDMSIVLTAGHTLPVVPEPTEDGRLPVSFELEDGILTIHNLPWGYYRVQEERAPDGYSLLPQHTAYSFWVLPPNVLVSVAESGGNGDGDFEDGGIEAMIAAILNDNLGGPAYDLPDGLPPSEAEGGGVEFIINEEENVNSILVTFENYPFSEVVVEKLCRETNRPLADAIFRIEGFFVEGNAPQVINMTGRTGADGRYTFRGLPAGGFTVSEVSAPPGFMLDEPSFQHVNVSWGQTAGHATRPAPVLTFLNTPMAYLEVIKVDGENPSARLDGAVFRLTGPDQHGATVVLYGTTSGGTVRFEPLLPHATYILEEVSPPAGFVLMEGSQTIVTTTGRNEVTWRNWRNPGLTIIKRCQDTGAYLAGAVFTVEALGTGSPLPIDLELTTDASGRIFIPWTLFEGEAERTFRVTEVVAPPGFHLDNPNWQIVTLVAGYDNTVVFQNRRMPTITIQKRDSVTGVPIANAEFTIEKITEPGRGMLTGNPFRTDANGLIVLPFQHAGMYRIVETRPAPNYWLDPLEQNRSWTIEVRANEDYLLVVENTLLPSLVITKWNALTHRPVPLTHFRVEFEVPNSGNVILIGNFVTNQNGQIILPFVQSGWYRITETRPAPGMSLNVNNNYRVFLAPGQNTYELMRQGLMPNVFENIAPYPASAVVPPEIPEQTEPLPPTENPPDDEFVIESDNPGSYVVNIHDIEIVENPALVAQLTSGISVTGGDSWVVGEGVWNWPLNSIVIKKTDITNGRLLAGATFDLIHVSTGESGTRGTVIGTFTTNHSGIVVITGLEPGAYVVEETIPPPNYMLAVNNRQHAFLRPDGFSIVETHFSNYPFGSLLVTLRCEVTGLPIQNGEFRVTTSDGTVVGTGNGLFRTNQEGYFLIPNLRPDSYVVAQTWTPDAFELGSVVVPQTIHVRPDGQTYRLEFTNRPLSTLIIRKIDSYDNSPIAGARYRVYRQDNSFVGEHITDNQGLIEIPRMLGWFTVREVDVPHGFEFDMQTVRTVHVQPHAPALVTFYSPRLGSLTVEAVDEHGTPLAGATFRVNRQSGELVGTFTTGASGIINIPNLTSGWYFVEATSAPNGFMIGEEGRSVEVLANTAPVTRFVFPRLSVLTIEKVDDMGRPLAGATFEVRRPNGERIAIGTTNNAGIFVLNNIQPGTVIIEETQAPAGFAIVEQARTVEFAPGQNRIERFRNYRLGTLVIENIDENHNPLQGGRFRVSRPNGEVVGDFLAPVSGIITIPNLTSGAYIVEQISPPPGFVLGETGRTVEVLANQTVRTTFTNTRQPSLTIEKVDESGNPLQGAEFEIRRPNGVLVLRTVTNNGGLIHVPNLAQGTYIIEETRAPQGFVITEPARTVEIVAGQARVERFVNHRAPSLIIEKADQDGNPLGGAVFEIRRLNGELVAQGVTNQGGMLVFDGIAPGVYEIIETQAPQGFVITEPSRAVQIVAGQTLTERFINHRAPSLIIEKVDQDGNPLGDAEFEVRRLNGELVHRVVTNQGGMAIIDVLAPGSYELIETRAPEGFAIVEPSRAIQVVAGQTLVERFVNPRLATFVIHKIDGDTNEPLQGVVFEITTLAGERIRNPINGGFEFTTDNVGMIRLPMLAAGSYVAVETRPLPGYMAAEPTVFVVGHDRDYIITIRNFRYPDINIRKIDGHTGEPLMGVQFEIARFFANGSVGERLRNPVDGSFVWTTDRAGLIRIPNLEHGTFVATETRALPGYMLAEPVVFVVGDNQPTTLTIRNYRYSEWNILKLDGDTNQPLQGVVFEVAHFFGTGTTGERLRNPLNGTFEFVSDAAGIARIGVLQPGTYIITETRALPGFRIAEPVIITVGANDVNTTVTIRNYRDAQLTIRKINSVTRAPLEGVVFEISRPDGTRLVNPQTGFHDFVTDRNGLIFLPVIEDGRFYLRETRALPGFIVDEEVIAFNIDASARQRDHVLTVENTPAAGLLVVVTDSQTRRPLEGIEIEVRRTDGQIVTGQMLHGNQPSTPANSPQLAANGNFLTDRAGRVNLNHLPPGVYHVRVMNTARGSQADTDIHVVTVAAVQQAVLEIRIAPLAGFRLLHFDAITEAPIFNAEFMVFDHNNQVVGNFQTDNMGVIDFSALLVPGRYTIRLTRPAPGYSRDDVPRTVEFIAGRVTEIRWEAIPIAGQLQIQVVGGANNEQNALPAGTPLTGAIFEIFSERTGNLVDRIITNQRGMAVSRPLPLGRYYAVQVAAPPHYMINPQPIPFEIEFASQIVRFTFPNFPANTGVTINLQGQREAMQGHSIFYDIRTIRNDSTIPLGNFYWRAILPTNAVRADRLITGTFNHSLRYTITARTNRGHDIVVADNLSSTRNNVIELRPVHLGLAANEYLVELTISFGQVPAGFTAVERPRLHVDVLSEQQAFLPDGMMFAMKVDVGGRVPGSDEWVIGNDTWATTIFNPRRLPRSGF